MLPSCPARMASSGSYKIRSASDSASASSSKSSEGERPTAFRMEVAMSASTMARLGHRRCSNMLSSTLMAAPRLAGFASVYDPRGRRSGDPPSGSNARLVRPHDCQSAAVHRSGPAPARSYASAWSGSVSLTRLPREEVLPPISVVLKSERLGAIDGD